LTVKNGLSAIANEVVDDVQKEAESIILKAEAEAKDILRSAKEQAIRNYDTALNQATSKADGEKRKIASVTEVDIRNRQLQAKESLVDAAFDKVVEKLIDFASSQNYQAYLIKLIEDVAKKIGEKHLVIELNTKDKAWLTHDKLIPIMKKLDTEIIISEETRDFIGGCIVQNQDGKVAYDSTIDSRLKELKPFLRVEVAKILFEKES